MMHSVKGALQPIEANVPNGLQVGENSWQNNEKILYIEVEYIKEDIAENDLVSQPLYTEFEPNVIALDPNISTFDSVYSDSNAFSSTAEINTHLEKSVAKESLVVNPTEDIGNNFMPLINSEHEKHKVNGHAALENNQQNNQEVDILITDQTTGLSYIVERCLNDTRLLENETLLDSDLLSLDENALKTQLSGIIIDSSLTASDADKIKENKIENAKNQSLDLFTDNETAPCVQQICDRPILTRAWASLPESHLMIKKNQFGECSVFAKKFIPCRTQFGPIEGVLLMDNIKQCEDQLHLSIELNGVLHILDVSDENNSNWMCFVQPAHKFSEQNLILTQHENYLYFITTKNILPKQELLVGYGKNYAKLRNLPILEPFMNENDLWRCFECTKQFPSSEEYFKHLDEHEDASNKKKKHRDSPEETTDDDLQCNLCNERFSRQNQNLKEHLVNHGVESGDIFKYFNNLSNPCPMCKEVFASGDELKRHYSDQHEKIAKKHETQEKKKNEYKCPVCPKVFASSDRIQNHILVHGSDDAKPFQCDKCSKRFLNNSALACHLKTHLLGLKIYECPICNESFRHVLELKTHVPQHAVNGTYTCPHCKKVFKKYSIVRKHIRAFHCDKKFNCRDCPKSFPTVDKLRMHLLTHSDHREFLCADCGKQFKRKDKLKEHCKKMHVEDNDTENSNPKLRKLAPRAEPSSDYYRFIYKCHRCLVGFKRRGMLVNHLAKRHPDVSPESVPELNLPILRATRDYYCNYCDKIYKSSSKRKAHILKNHPGLDLPLSNRKVDRLKTTPDCPNPTFSQTVGSVTTHPQACKWCHKQYASKAKLLQHQRKKHADKLNEGKGNDAARMDDSLVTDEGQYYQYLSLNNNNVEQQQQDGSRLYNFVNIPNNLVPPR